MKKTSFLTLGIETSCDDTSVAIVNEKGQVLAIANASQDEEHELYGGIVPEIASRNHSVFLLPLIDRVLKEAGMTPEQLNGIAVTNRPGLVGALIVGLVTAKTLSQSWGIPYLGVNHLEGHLLAPFLRDDAYGPPLDFTYPYVGLAISGGHTSLYYIEGLGRYHLLGATKDDAAGEAFDKFAKMVGLGFPGGSRVDKAAKLGDRTAFDFPRSMIKENNLDMSFSGLKSAAHRLVESLGPDEVQSRLNDLCASYQEAIIDVLMAKLDRARNLKKITKVILTGGVSANSRLRERAEKWAQAEKLQLVIPPIRYCTDNGAMIALAGSLRMQEGQFSPLSLSPLPQVLPDDFIQVSRDS